MPKDNNLDHDNWRDRVAALVGFAQTQTGGDKADMLVDLEYALVTVLAVAVGDNKDRFNEGVEIMHKQINDTAAELAKRMT